MEAPLTPGPSLSRGEGRDWWASSIALIDLINDIYCRKHVSSGPSVDVEAREGRGVAVAAILEGFELVEGVLEDAVEVGLVAHQHLQRVVARQEYGKVLEMAALVLAGDG